MPCLRHRALAHIPAACSLSPLMICSSVNLPLRIVCLLAGEQNPNSKSRAFQGSRSGRLRAHQRSKRKSGGWTHFSVFEVWENVTKEEIEELEGLARHLYRYDSTANTMNLQRGYKKLRTVRENDVRKW